MQSNKGLFIIINETISQIKCCVWFYKQQWMHCLDICEKNAK